jgi:putative tricarboxylic transport membrane protein
MVGVLALCVAGVYAIDNSMGNVYVMFAFGILGYFMRKLGFPVAPIILTLLLAAMLETSLHRALLISAGDWSIFVKSSLSQLFVAVAVLSIVLQIPGVLRLIGRLFGIKKAAPDREKIFIDE